MITSIKRLFSKKNTAESEDIPNQKKDSNPNFITDPAKIIHLLKDIESETAFCTITLSHSDETYTSHITAVQENKKLILLDSLLPSLGNSLLEQCQTLKLTTYLNNIHLAITLTNVQVNKSGGSYFSAPLPERIYYPQRRKSPRIGITTFNLKFQGISRRTQLTVGGILYDLSRQGIGVIINASKTRVQRGDELTNCILTLPNKKTIHFDLLIRSTKPYSNSRTKFLIGGHFILIKSNKEQSHLEQFFALAERSAIRKQKDY